MTGTPRLKAPQGACDTHMHVYDTERFPARNPKAPALDARVPAYRAVQKALGFERVVVVQPNAYADDNRCTLDAIARLGPGARGVGVVAPGASDAELRRLDAGGIRALRFFMLPFGFLGWAELETMSARIEGLGWHSIVQLDGGELAERKDQLKRIAGRFVIDHTGKFLEPVAPDHPSFRALLELVDTGRCWVKLAAPYETSKRGPPGYDDVGALAKALVRAAPERMLWASNWPHPSAQPSPPDDAALLDLLLDWAPDETARRKILVDNPATLYGF